MIREPTGVRQYSCRVRSQIRCRAIHADKSNLFGQSLDLGSKIHKALASALDSSSTYCFYSTYSNCGRFAVGRREHIMSVTEEVAGVSISVQDQKDILDLYAKIRAAEAKLVGPDGKTQLLPSNLYSFLCQLLGDLKAGKSVTILQNNAELTTVEAAKMLAVSRQFLIQLLGQNQIPFHMVGTHRRLYARDILAFKGRRDSARRKTLDDLARTEMEEGLYDRVPLDDPNAR